MKKFRADLKYHLLAIDGVCENEPDRYQGLLKRLEKDLRGAAAWGILGFPKRSWAAFVLWWPLILKGMSLDQAPGSHFRHRSSRAWKREWNPCIPPAGHQHIGKVVLKVPPRMKLSPEASYVLSGGMGALGLITAQALAEEGAKSLLLLSRSGRPGSEVEQQWKWLQQSSLQATALGVTWPPQLERPT